MFGKERKVFGIDFELTKRQPLIPQKLPLTVLFSFAFFLG